jgi:aminoglycoside 3-N-acetyltransferase
MTTVTREDIRQAAEALGLKQGDTVLIHSSFKSLGFVEGGAESVIGGFRDAIGQEGNLVFPTLCQRDFEHAYENWHLDAPSDVGYLTNYFRKLPGALRSDQATHSVAAQGPDAEYLTCTHGQTGKRYGVYGDTPFSADSPWEKMYQMNATVVFLGVGIRSCTFRHYAEYRFVEQCLEKAKSSPEYARLKDRVQCYGKNQENAVWPHTENEYVLPFLEKAGKVSRVRCGDAELLAVSAREFVDQTLALLEARDAQLYRYDQDSPKRKQLVQWIADIDAL